MPVMEIPVVQSSCLTDGFSLLHECSNANRIVHLVKFNKIFRRAYIYVERDHDMASTFSIISALWWGRHSWVHVLFLSVAEPIDC